MKNIFSLTKRNMLLFLRNKQTVFFSFFSSIILIVLYFLFIAKLYSQNFNEYSGLALSGKQIDAAIYIQMIMGVLVLNSVSLSTGMFTFMASDLETRKTEAFMLTRLKPYELMVSYLVSALIVSFSLNLLMLILSIIIIGSLTGVWLGFVAFLSIVGVLVLTTIVSCAVMLFITAVVRSSNAIGIINGILGTLLGFLCGIYMPYTNLGSAAKSVGSLLPFTHFTVWLKNIALTDVFSQMGVSDSISKIMQETWFSAENVGFCGLNVPLWAMILISTIVGIICLVVSVLIIKMRLLRKQNKTIRIKTHKKAN